MTRLDPPIALAENAELEIPGLMNYVEGMKLTITSNRDEATMDNDNSHPYPGFPPIPP